MKKSTLSKLSFAILVTFALSGCHLTSRALDNIDAVPETVITDENIYSFGFTKPDSKNLPPNRLVLLTEKTAYVTDITPDNEMVKVLRTTELSKQFEVVNRENRPKKLGYTHTSQTLIPFQPILIMLMERSVSVWLTVSNRTPIQH